MYAPVWKAKIRKIANFAKRAKSFASSFVTNIEVFKL